MQPTSRGFRSLLGTVAGLFIVSLAIATGMTPAKAQSANAEQLCTPDVMRLCSEFIPSRGPITSCLIRKMRQLSPGCRTVMSPKKGKKIRHARGRG